MKSGEKQAKPEPELFDKSVASKKISHKKKTKVEKESHGEDGHKTLGEKKLSKCCNQKRILLRKLSLVPWPFKYKDVVSKQPTKSQGDKNTEKKAAQCYPI
jgi:hypothetical protein